MQSEAVRPNTIISGPRSRLFAVLFMLFVIVAAAIIRSSIATGLDSFTFDEAYHVGAGTAYVKTGDFRLNPEHPPLVKLWVGAFVSSLGFQLSPYRPYADKGDERDTVESDVYLNNDPNEIQSRARMAMFVFNGLLLFLFAFAVWRSFGEVMAVAATLFLAIDPTVAAHFPVVMTDLPVALLSSAAVLYSVAAFRSWHIIDLVFAAAVLGLALGAKHSAIITAVAVALIGVAFVAFAGKGVKAIIRLKRVGMVSIVLIGALMVLWSLYGLRYNESPQFESEQFNRPLAEKISDLKSPLYREGLRIAAKAHLLPRAYVWGLADTIRTGAEGNAASILLFGDLYYNKGPFYYFPGIIAVKLPLGLLLLSAIGAGLLLARRLPSEWLVPIMATAALSTLFLLALMGGSSYAGIRHALPIVPFLAILAAAAIYRAAETKLYILLGLVFVLFLGAMVSAVPVMRPWEYYNELAGGTADGHLYFSDEGVDLGLRAKELAKYYDENLKPNGEIPFLIYFSPRSELRSRGVDWVGQDRERDGEALSEDTQTGTFIVGAKEMAPSLFWDIGKRFRGSIPVARFGNLMVFRGTFPGGHSAQAASLFFGALYGAINTSEPNISAGIDMLNRSVTLDPSPFFVWLELGNQYLKIGDRENALRAYRVCYERSPQTDKIHQLIGEQIKLVEAGQLDQIAPLRNPATE